MKTVPISEFRRDCLKLLAKLPKEGITVTRHGRAVAKVTRMHRSPVDLIGTGRDLRTDPNDDLFSTGVRWDAES